MRIKRRGRRNRLHDYSTDTKKAAKHECPRDDDDCREASTDGASESYPQYIRQRDRGDDDDHRADNDVANICFCDRLGIKRQHGVDGGQHRRQQPFAAPGKRSMCGRFFRHTSLCSIVAALGRAAGHLRQRRWIRLFRNTGRMRAQTHFDDSRRKYPRGFARGVALADPASAQIQ